MMRILPLGFNVYSLAVKGTPFIWLNETLIKWKKNPIYLSAHSLGKASVRAALPKLTFWVIQHRAAEIITWEICFFSSPNTGKWLLTAASLGWVVLGGGG